MTPALKRRACAATKADGTPCSSRVLTEEGLQRLLDGGIHLIPDAGAYCSYHARSEDERIRMQKRGGSWSPKKEAKERAEREALPDPMPREYAISAYRLIGSLLDAKLPNVWPPEADYRKQALGAFLAACTYTLGEDERAHYAYKLLPHELRNRPDVLVDAEGELRTVIEELETDRRDLAWSLTA